MTGGSTASLKSRAGSLQLPGSASTGHGPRNSRVNGTNRRLGGNSRKARETGAVFSSFPPPIFFCDKLRAAGRLAMAGGYSSRPGRVYGFNITFRRSWAHASFWLVLLLSLFLIGAVLTGRILSASPVRTSLMLLIPVGIAVLPLIFPRARLWLAWVAALLLFACVAIGAASVGLFYIPAAIAMLIAAIRITANSPPRGRTGTPQKATRI